jgi:pimeloyl-ACP methyl ester carboxylesterase
VIEMLEELDVPQSSTCGYSPWEFHGSGPFETVFDVQVAGGALSVARAGVPPGEAAGVVLALHGMTGTHMAYRTVGRELCRAGSEICLLAPDLRGRGRSAALPEPYGMAAHVRDLIAVLDQAGVGRAVVVGHSMGCNVAARLAADHPERIAGVVLLDGGLPILPEDVMVGDHDGDEEPHGILDRFEASFADVDEYMAYWHAHPGLTSFWDDDIDAFARCDFVVGAEGVRCVANLTSVRADVRDVMLDGLTWTSAARVRAPVRLMRAERGMYDDDPLIPLDELDAFCRANPHVSADLVPDVNHFTLLLGGGHGPLRVAATLTELAQRQ